MPTDLKYVLRADAAGVSAARWFKNGDHPLDYASDREGVRDGDPVTFTGEECRAAEWEGEVVRRYESSTVDPAKECGVCGYVMHQHGWLDQGEFGVVVCPGDFVVDLEDGARAAVRGEVFAALFRESAAGEEEGASDSEPSED